MTNDLRIKEIMAIILDMETHGITQTELALASGLKQPYLSMIFGRAKVGGHVPIRDAKIKAITECVKIMISSKLNQKEKQDE